MPEISLNTRVDRVTVHRNGALVVRVGAIAPPSWPLDLVLPGLPLLFHADTVRVRCDAPGVTVGPVEEAPELMLGAAPPPIDEEARARHVAAVAAATDEVAAWTALEEATAALTVPAKVELPREAPPELPALVTWAALHDLAADRRATVAAGLAAARLRLRQAQEASAAFARQNDQRRAAPVRYTRALRARLHLAPGAALPARLGVEVEYFVSGARWVPTYALDLRGDRAALALSALIAQATGEDWVGARVRVSTADLRRSTSLPKLAAWKIGRATTPPKGGWRPLPEDLEGLFADADASPRPAPTRPAPARAEPAAPPAMAASEVAEKTRGGRAPPAMSVPAGVDFAVPEAPAPQSLSRARAMAPPPPAAMPRRAGAAMGGAPLGGASPGGAPPAGSVAMMDEEADGAGFSGAPLGGAPPGGAPPGGMPPAPPPPVHPGLLLDYAWLRLPSNEERGRRGRLWPVDAFSDLRALLEERAELDRYADLQRALDRQRDELSALARAPLPPGCAPLPGSAFPYRFDYGPLTDVPADGRFHQIPVASAEGSARQVCRVVPRQAASAWRTAMLDNLLAAPLPAGPLRVSVDGAWRVTSAMPATGAGGKLALNLGVEDGLRVARNATYTESEKGMLTSVTHGQHRVVTELRSRLDAPVEIELWERLPLAPEGSDLTIQLDEQQPPAEAGRGPDGERADGALKWTLRLGPGESTTVRYTWTARVPARMEIVGGNRREP